MNKASLDSPNKKETIMRIHKEKKIKKSQNKYDDEKRYEYSLSTCLVAI